MKFNILGKREMMFIMWTFTGVKFSLLNMACRKIKNTIEYFPMLRFPGDSFKSCIFLYHCKSQVHERSGMFVQCLFYIVPILFLHILLSRALASTHWFAFSSRHLRHSVVDSELDGCAVWNFGFLVSITWLKAWKFRNRNNLATF